MATVSEKEVEQLRKAFNKTAGSLVDSNNTADSKAAGDSKLLKDQSFAKKVFWVNPYQHTLFTTVNSVNNNQVSFHETIAYSFSGGQERDNTVVNGMPVLDSKYSGHDILYTLKDDHGLKPGDIVNMEIDWGRRNRLMRLHFSCELVLVIVNRMFGIKTGKKKAGEEINPEDIDNVGIVKTGAHMSESSARVDFRFDGNFSQFLPQITQEFKTIIDANHAIEKGYINEKEQERYWRIKGLATIPCGGTHVRSTKEIGYVTLKRDKAGKGSERVKITLQNPEPTQTKIPVDESFIGDSVKAIQTQFELAKQKLKLTANNANTESDENNKLALT